MIYIGIDPGASGAIAVLDAGGQIVSIADMPTIMVRVGKTERHRVSPAMLAHLFEMDQHAVQMVVLEKVGGMTGQSASAAFTFGYGAGIVEGVLAALKLPVALVTPQSWKRSAGIATDKGAAREAAMRLWPAHASRFARVKDDGRAEAALIARHGWLRVARVAA
ncbi:RuvC family protein [Acidiphilium iwatense]|uniref:Uncharacterized protein n=1 Tax=Acidiphilium iwatense TaxID=768198 RepID=A0ABS9DYJ1_9PROT|nr:hypothetical protein [Acidiphilium iwatense]MCF3947758.1 hypothetical protein [Acidiphilium iwatense]